MIDRNANKKTIEHQRKEHHKKVQCLKGVIRDLKCRLSMVTFQRNLYLAMLILAIVINLLRKFA